MPPKSMHSARKEDVGVNIGLSNAMLNEECKSVIRTLSVMTFGFIQASLIHSTHSWIVFELFLPG